MTPCIKSAKLFRDIESELARAMSRVESLSGDVLRLEAVGMAHRDSLAQAKREDGALRADNARLTAEWDAAVKRAEAAENVVSKLPHTVDGVPILAGMTVYVVPKSMPILFDGTVRAFNDIEGNAMINLWVRHSENMTVESQQKSSDCYSTKELAIAAQSAARGGRV